MPTRRWPSEVAVRMTEELHVHVTGEDCNCCSWLSVHYLGVGVRDRYGRPWMREASCHAEEPSYFCLVLGGRRQILAQWFVISQPRFGCCLKLGSLCLVK